MNDARGHALAVVLLVLAVCSAIGCVVWLRLELAVRTAADRDHRTDSLWLARSAAAAGRTGERVATVNGALATVRTSREGNQTVAVALAAPWRARVVAEPGPGGRWIVWDESAERLPP